MTVKLNLNKARRKVLPDADYIAEIAVCEQAQAKGGAPKLHLEYLIDEETHPEFGGVRVFSDISLQEQSWFRVVELVEAALGPAEAQDEEGNFEFDPGELQGAKVAIAVSIDDSYDGIPRNKVGTIYPVAEYAPEEAEETEGE